MVVAILSDTHIPERLKVLPEYLTSFLQSVDCILHAGDIVEWWVLEELSQFAPVYAVCGNMDTPSVCTRLPAKRVVELEGVRIGLVHGRGSPEEAEKVALTSFAEENVNVVVYGHSHRPLLVWRREFLLVNPGSPTDKVFSPCLTMGRLEIASGKVCKGEIIRLD
ncbi:MAG: metallophosphatase family protein [Candidatus Caldatribacterium sp.]|uniref:metallophosphoesterase family protein n=1 Tax=Candidatus Caldatribacterium sp. TaxID=2282143 RepID=UPI002994852D|nr:metallophosphatase family protein [Candidatus Caldatribacterium sp.]MCX7730379.1 metallophosphatase family protein [Candidatus Caldatribacterium sp.]MDW8080659.1 metallophosphoesterase family protein [Candidatus Calescibacterium sp.]